MKEHEIFSVTLIPEHAVTTVNSVGKYSVGNNSVTKIEFYQNTYGPAIPFFKFYNKDKLLFEINARSIIRIDYIQER